MTLPDVAACIEAVNILEESTELVDKLWSNAELFQSRNAQYWDLIPGKCDADYTGDVGGSPLAQQFSRNFTKLACLGWQLVSPPCRQEKPVSG